MLNAGPQRTVPDTRLVLRVAIAHARYRLALWLEDDGISEDECLTQLVELLFHPAMDVVASSRPQSDDTSVHCMWKALRGSRRILRLCCGPKPSLNADDCLHGLVGTLNDPELVKAGEFRAMLTCIQWGPAIERRRQPLAWCIRRALGV